MNRLKITIRNFAIIAILFFLFMNLYGLYLTPMEAHKQSEHSIHYGPSRVVHVEEYDNERYMLGKYDKWVSCNTVRKIFFFWTLGDQPIGFENDLSKGIDYSWNGATDQRYLLYGAKNDDNIEKVEFTLGNGDVFSTTTFHENLFLIILKHKDDGVYIKNIKGYDKDNNIIYEQSD